MPDIELDQYPQHVQEFARYKLTVQNCSPQTVLEYLFDLRTFLRYMVNRKSGNSTDEEQMENTDITSLTLDFYRSVTTADVYDFLTYTQQSRQNGSCARARKLSSIKAFYKFLTIKMHYLEINPAANIEAPRQKRQLPKHLSVHESVDLLSAVQSDTDSKTRARDYAILTLFLNCGMRLSELVGISFPDLDPELRSLRVLGKGAKERIVYLNDACRMALQEYLPVRMTQNPKPKDAKALFLSGQGNRISVKTVQWMVKKYLAAAGLTYKQYSTHKLRHTAATLMYQTGAVDIRVLKDILGHEQLTTTQIYTHVSDSNMEKAMTLNPLAEIHIQPSQKSLSDTESDEDTQDE